MSISTNLNKLLAQLPPSVRLVAVSKTHPSHFVQEAYLAGQRLFGENKVQELLTKYQTLPKDIDWHFIGHLQRNKVKYIAPFVSLIHSVDRFKLLQTIDTEGEKNNRILDVLIQFHIAEEESKFGFDIQEARQMLQSEQFVRLKYVRVMGVMGMATFTEDQLQIRREFKELRKYFEILQHEYFADREYFSEISMGMSGDYQIAIQEGSTMIRVGSYIFGDRDYPKSYTLNG